MTKQQKLNENAISDSRRMQSMPSSFFYSVNLKVIEVLSPQGTIIFKELSMSPTIWNHRCVLSPLAKD